MGLGQLAEIRGLDGCGAPALYAPRPDRRALDRFAPSPARDVAEHDHRTGDGTDVVGAQAELLPLCGDVREVLAQAGVAAVRPRAPGEPRRALEMQLAI